MGSTAKSRWLCHHCPKYLSSKRSYDEHMNIHNRARPFSCDQCDYAAASQMTLRRHKLRNHVPRQAWGYHCPHCTEAFMEPASYQQHVLSRHLGQSATFGCKECNFTTKCSRQFQQHLFKHVNVRVIRKGDAIRGDEASSVANLSAYLVDDELGSGYGKTPAKPAVYRIDQHTCRVLKSGGRVGNDPFSAPLVRFAKKLALDGDFLKTPLTIVEQAPSSRRASRSEVTTVDQVVRPLFCPPEVPEEVCLEVGNEVVIDSSAEETAGPLAGVTVLPNGHIEMELD